MFSTDAEVFLCPFHDFGQHSSDVTSPFVDFLSVFICGSVLDGKLDPIEDDEEEWGDATLEEAQ